jgi:hypothetical protein
MKGLPTSVTYTREALEVRKIHNKYKEIKNK